MEGHRRTEQEREWRPSPLRPEGGSGRCQVSRGAVPSRGRPRRRHQQKLHGVLTGEQGRTLSTLEVVPWERLRKKLEDRCLAGLGAWKGATSRSKLEGVHAVIIWDQARDMDRSAELDLRDRALGLPFKALTIISVLRLFVGSFNCLSLPLDCKLHKGRNSTCSHSPL